MEQEQITRLEQILLLSAQGNDGPVTMLTALKLIDEPNGLLLKDLIDQTGLTRHQVSRVINSRSENGYRGEPIKPLLFRVKERAGKEQGQAGRPRRIYLTPDGKKLVNRLLTGKVINDKRRR